MPRLTERDFLRTLRQRAASASPVLCLGIGDDCAVLRPPKGSEVVVTTDLMLESIHFRHDWHPAELAGHRCIARGLSDLAAMGAKPMAAFLSLALPAGRQGRWADAFFRGLLALAGEYETPLAGGDLAQSKTGIIADIVLMGTVPAGRALLRSGARPGDMLYVTGALGAAAAELARLERAGGTARHKPQPRIAVGQALLRRSLATACIDLSDGISTDLDHLCEESRVSAEIDAGLLPVHPTATLQQALHGGEDYELLFSARPEKHIPRSIRGVPVTQIGRITAARKTKPRLSLLADGKTQGLRPGGWEHFAARLKK